MATGQEKVSMASPYFYEPKLGHGLAHDPFKAIVAPRPIGWISTRDKEGQLNLAPYSFFNAISTFPPIVAFCSEGWKDSVSNAQATGEFVTNFVSRSLAERMNLTSKAVEHGINEMELAGLSAAPGVCVDVPHVAEAPAALECKLLQIIQLHDIDGKALENWLTIGQVVGVHIDSQYLHDGIFDTLAASPILRAGYRADYAVITEMFQMSRPKG
jgi:flavin reductase (DIM6/NTAB) family NADH-FMN oxidoreductase RutF